MNEKIMELIMVHNTTIHSLEAFVAENEISERTLMKGMEVWHGMAVEGAIITEMARAVGIDAKVSMRKGEISVT